MTSDRWEGWCVPPVRDALGQNYHTKHVVGISVSKPALDMTKEDFTYQMDANVWGSFTCAQAAALYVPFDR